MISNHPSHPRIDSILRPTRLLGLVLLTVLAAASGQAEEFVRNVSRTLPLSSGRVQVRHSMGEVTIRTQDRPNVVVSATVRTDARSKDAAEELSRKIEVHIEQDGEGVTIRTGYPRTMTRGLFNRISFSVDYDIVMPSRAQLDLINRFGDVKVTGLAARGRIVNGHGRIDFQNGAGTQHLENAFGAIDVKALNGDLELVDGNAAVSIDGVTGSVTAENRFGATTVSNVAGAVRIDSANGKVAVSDVGGAVSVRNSFGTVDAVRLEGDLEIVNANGGITVEGVRGKADLRTTFASVVALKIGHGIEVRASNSKVSIRSAGGPAVVENTFGSVALQEIRGPATVGNQNGDVRLETIQGDATVHGRFGLVTVSGIGGDLRVDNANGGIKVTDIAGNAELETTFAPIFLDGVKGSVEIENSNGSISVEGLRGGRCQPVSLTGSFGSIQIRLPQNSGYDLEASTSFGKIDSSHPITVNGSMGEDHLRGRIGNGGCRLVLKNRNGGIRIR